MIMPKKPLCSGSGRSSCDARRNRTWSLPSICGCILPMCWLSFASPAAEPFRFQERVIKLAEMGEVKSCFLGWGSDEYAFLPPRNWLTTSADPGREVVFQSMNAEATIRIRILAGPPGAGSHPDRLKHKVLHQFNEAKIKEEFPCYTGASPGKGFEVEWIAINNHRMLSRIGFVPLAGAALEFTLTAKPAAMPAYHAAFGSLLTSFHQTSSRRTDEMAKARD